MRHVPRVEAWTVIIPVKHTTHGKSRLTAPARDRVALARAFAIDTVSAAAACEEVGTVIVVTDDPHVATLTSSLADIVPEPPAGGLNATIAAGAAAGAGPRAALLGDLPALRATDLQNALVLAREAARAVVADADGTGSNLITVGAGLPWISAFGPDSFAAHVAAGFIPLDLPDSSSLRHDVDTIEQLHAARPLGLGSETASVLARV